MSYVVIRDFTDANENSADDNGKLHVYRKGESYPYSSYRGAATKDRLAQLLHEDGPNENFNGPVIKEAGD